MTSTVHRPSARPSLFLLLAVLLVAWPLAATAQTAGDADNDGLPDDWETQFGLDPSRSSGDNGAAGDPDRDGLTNLDEYRLGSHPRGFSRSTFAEGATGDLFDMRLALFNPDPRTASRVLFRFFTSTGEVVRHYQVIPPLGRASVYPEQLPGLQSAAFSTEVESDVRVVVDRTMWWNSAHYGSHAETGTPWPSTTWYFAEGATHSGFSLYYLIQNPATSATTVDVSFLLPTGQPVERSIVVAPKSRYTLYVNDEDARLASTDVSAVFSSRLPIVVERAMYLTRPGGRFFEAGTDTVGVQAPALRWFLAEGATGDFFDLFVLVANPGDQAAQIQVTYLLPDGTTIVKPWTVAAHSRSTIWVDSEDPRLASTSVSTTVESLNEQPILVERAMWWPGGPSTWTEAHSAAGVTGAATRWALAEGENGGRDDAWTFYLVANVSSTPGVARVTLFYEEGGQEARDFAVPASSRLTVHVRDRFPSSMGQRFAALVESVGATPIDMVVERAMYSDAEGRYWAAGTDAVATPLDNGVVAMTARVAVVTISSDGAQASELGPRPATLTISRTDTAAALTVYYATVGTAAPSDYAPLEGRVTFAPGQATATVTVTPVDDGDREADETVVVSIAGGPGYLVGRWSSVIVTIADDDARPDDGVTPSQVDAVRFLNQAAFGPTWTAVREVQQKGYRNWFEDQVNAPRSGFLGYLDGITGETVSQSHLQEMWFTAATTGPDQLRQRVANALLEIAVVSQSGGLDHVALASYMDMLMRDAFGNFRTVLQDVTLHPAMGRYLNMLQNAKEDLRTGRNPNENYARELLQLFSIGLFRLNLDGTPMLDGNGQPIPTYDQAVVEGFAKVFTGWTFFQTTEPYRFYPPANYRMPMMALPTYHSTSAKALLDGATIPASATSMPEQDLAVALDAVFNHPNVGPFIAKLLIQRLVTSNPSPGYVARVATVFNDNEAGVRGDLKAVVRAILFDDEARSPRIATEVGYGHLREPMIRFVSVMRAFNARAASGRYRISSLDSSMGQAPFRAPSVFNFFSPAYRKPGAIAQAGLVSPEFQITTETTAVSGANTIRSLIYYGYGSNADRIQLDLSLEQQMSLTPGALLDRLDTILFGGTMSPELRRAVSDAVSQVSTSRPLYRAQLAVMLLVNSPEWVVQK